MQHYHIYCGHGKYPKNPFIDTSQTNITNLSVTGSFFKNHGITVGDKDVGGASQVSSGIGAGSGKGGSQGENGTGGCLYILPTEDYCVFKLNQNASTWSRE